ncbi:MAG: hypothetical protein ACREXT_08775 [Gammaproteobacteria bacterium]
MALGDVLGAAGVTIPGIEIGLALSAVASSWLTAIGILVLAIPSAALQIFGLTPRQGFAFSNALAIRNTV